MFDLHYQDNIAWINFNSEGSLNLLNEKTLTNLLSLLQQIETEDTLGTVIYTTKKDFCCGADIQYLEVLSNNDQLYSLLVSLHQDFLTIQKPIVTIIQGKCLGGGLELALLSQYRIGIRDTHLEFSCPEASIGIMPGFGATQRLPRTIGLESSMQLLLSQKKFDEKMALESHLVHDLASKDNAKQLAIKYLKSPHTLQKTPYNPHTAHKLAFSYITSMCKGKTQGCYPNINYLLQATYEGSLLPLKDALSIEAMYFTKTLYEASHLSLLSHRIQLRKTYKSDKKPHIGIIGAGFMGSAIAKLAIHHQLPITVIERTDRLQSVQEKHPDLNLSDQPKDLKGCDIIIESVDENLSLKQSILSSIEPYISKDTLLCSNTSSIPISQIAKALKYPKRLIGFHFFSPVDKMPLIEIISHHNTKEAIHTAYKLAISLHKIPILVKDIQGFYTTNIIIQYLITALDLLTQGIDPILIENASKQIGMKVSPFILLDEIGIDIAKNVLHNIKKPKVIELITYLYQKNHLGRKTQQGFYHYPDKTFTKDLPFYPKKNIPFNIIKEKLKQSILKTAIQLHKQKIISTMDAKMGLFGLGIPPMYLNIFTNHYYKKQNHLALL